MSVEAERLIGAPLRAIKPGSKIFSENMNEMAKYMSPNRLTLLRVMRRYNRPCAIRKLAMDLYRDHQSVRKDVRELQSAGLIDETKDGMFFVPWDEIICQASLTESPDPQ